MLHLTTIQASAFKSTFECLKDVLNDVNLIFKPDGCFLTCLDSARTSLVDMQLAADNFEEYQCDVPEIVCGLNITNTFKLLKVIGNNDVLKLDMSDKEFLDIEILSESRRTNTKFRLKLLDINESRVECPEIEMSVITTLGSVDFQRLCRDMGNVGSEISITREKNIISLSCEGDFASQETSIECLETVDCRLSGLYSLKYLNIFSKSATMCPSLQIMQEQQNRFLTLQYRVANLGTLRFYLATKIEAQT